MHDCACAKRLYFHFRFKIWHHRVSWPPISCRTRKFRRFAYIWGRYRICMDFEDLLVMGILGENRGRGCTIVTPTNSLLLLGVLTSVPILVKIDKKMRPWEYCSQTDRYTDRLTDANRFYNIIWPMLYAIVMSLWCVVPTRVSYIT